MKASSAPVSEPASDSGTETNRPPSKFGGWAIALIFFAVLAVLIIANM